MVSKEVAKFLVGVSLDPAALQRFHAAPDAEINRFGLSDEAAKIIKSKDAPTIQKAIRDSFFKSAASNGDDVNINIVVVVLPA